MHHHLVTRRMGHVYRRVDDEAGIVHGMLRLAHIVAVEVYLHQVRSGDLVVVEAERVDQEVRLFARHARGKMAVYEFGPAEIVHQAIGGSELAAQHGLALGRRQRIDVDAGKRRVLRDVHVHGVSSGEDEQA